MRRSKGLFTVFSQFFYVKMDSLCGTLPDHGVVDVGRSTVVCSWQRAKRCLPMAFLAFGVDTPLFVRSALCGTRLDHGFSPTVMAQCRRPYGVLTATRVTKLDHGSFAVGHSSVKGLHELRAHAGW